MNDELAVDIRDLAFSYRRSAELLNVPSFQIHAGERVLLTGKSGSGKSTLLGLITGVLSGATGQIRVLGEDLASLNSGKRDRLRADGIGYIFQSFNLVPYLSLLENITLPVKLSAMRGARIDGDAEQIASELLSRLGLSGADLIKRRVTELSIGQQQRVAAARALIGAPPLIIADEPTSSLDEDAKQDFLALLLSEAGKTGATVLFVSHDRTLAPQFDRVVDLAELNQAVRKVEEPA